MTKSITLPDEEAFDLYSYLVMKGVSCYFTIEKSSYFTVYYDDSANSFVEHMVTEFVDGERGMWEVFEYDA
jgi:hypothetical protein